VDAGWGCRFYGSTVPLNYDILFNPAIPLSGNCFYGCFFVSVHGTGIKHWLAVVCATPAPAALVCAAAKKRAKRVKKIFVAVIFIKKSCCSRYQL
jgi:hypothetical protein